MSALHAPKQEVRPIKKDKILNVGELLKQTRLEKKYRLPHVVKLLNIKEAYIKALENENSKKFPKNSIYTLGFLRAYAQLLGLNAKELVDTFKKKHGLEIIHQVPALIPEAEMFSESEETTSKTPPPFSMQWSIVALGVFAGLFYVKDLGEFDHFFMRLSHSFLSFVE